MYDQYLLTPDINFPLDYLDSQEEASKNREIFIYARQRAKDNKSSVELKISIPHFLWWYHISQSSRCGKKPQS